MRSDGVQVARGVARVVLLVPFLNDDELACLVKERVQTVHDHDVQIEKQRSSLQVVERGGKTGQLEPAVAKRPGFALVELVKTDHRNRFDFNGWVDAGTVVCEAHEAERPVQMPAHHAVQFVDVFGAVFLAPLDAQHVDSLHESPFAGPFRSGRHARLARC